MHSMSARHFHRHEQCGKPLSVPCCPLALRTHSFPNRLLRVVYSLQALSLSCITYYTLLLLSTSNSCLDYHNNVNMLDYDRDLQTQI